MNTDTLSRNAVLGPHIVRNSDRCNVKAGRPRPASVSEVEMSFA